MSQSVQCSFERFEIKYLVSPEQQEQILRTARRYMRDDEYGRYSICNIYYDTDDFALIRASLEKPVYKEKLRVRSYGVPKDGGRVFVEIKKKFDGVVYKRRTVTSAQDAPLFLCGDLSRSDGGQISREIDCFQRRYRSSPQVFIGYDRMALAGVENEELRMTFDTDLRWRRSDLDLRAGDGGMLLLPENKVLMELKIPGAAPLWLSRMLSELEIYPTSYSKYGAVFRDHILTEKELKKSA